MATFRGDKHGEAAVRNELVDRPPIDHQAIIKQWYDLTMQGIDPMTGNPPIPVPIPPDVVRPTPNLPEPSVKSGTWPRK